MADKVRVLRGCGRLSLFSLRLRELSPFRRRKRVSFARNLHRCTRLHQNRGSTHSGEDAEKCIETDVGIEYQAGMAEEPEPQRQAAMEEFESKRAEEWGKDQQCDHAEELKMTECIGEKEEKYQEELQVEEGTHELSMDVLVVVDHERRGVEQEPCVIEDVQGAEGARGTKEEKEYFPEGDGELPPHESVVSNGDVEGVPGLFVVDTEPGLGKNLYIETESTETEKEEKEKRKNKSRRKGGGAADASEAREKIAAEMVNPSEGVPGLFVVDTEPGLGKNLYIEIESTETGKEEKEKRKNKLRRKGGGAADASKAREKIAAEMVNPSEGVRKDTHRVEHVECEKKSEERPRLKDKRKVQRKEKNSLRQKPPTSIDVGELPADFDTPCIDIMGSGRSAAVMRVQLRQSEIKEQRQRREKKLKDKSKTWFELPMTEVSPEIRQNLLALRLRDSADPKRFYKPPDRAGFPKHFQMGTVLNSPVEFYSSQISRKMRKRNFLEEMMADAEQRSFRKRKMASIMAESQAKSAGKKIWLRLGGYKVLKRGVGKGGNGRNSTLASKKQKEKEKRKQRRLDL